MSHVTETSYLKNKGDLDIYELNNHYFRLKLTIFEFFKVKELALHLGCTDLEIYFEELEEELRRYLFFLRHASCCHVCKDIDCCKQV